VKALRNYSNVSFIVNVQAAVAQEQNKWGFSEEGEGRRRGEGYKNRYTTPLPYPVVTFLVFTPVSICTGC